MLDANEIVEEYMEHYECLKEKAIKMALEDLKLAEKGLLEMLIKEVPDGETERTA